MGFFDLVRRYGHKGASTSKPAPKHALLRAAAVEASISSSTENGNVGGRRFFNEAETTVQLGKILGVEYNGTEEEILIWNIRGIGRQEKRGKIRKLVKDRNIDIVLIQETKKSAITNKEVRKMRVRTRMEFMSVDSEGIAGGLLCIWDPEVFQLGACCSSRRFILSSSTISNSFECVLLNIYAPNDVGSRRKLWDSLLNLKQGFPKPWCLCGDFNEIRNIGERKGYSSRERGMTELNEFIENSKVQDLPLLGRKYTWCNSRECVKWSRIDRVLVDPRWLEVWKESEPNGWAGFILQKKLKDLKLALRQWNKEMYGSVPNKLKAVEEEAHILDIQVESRELD
ncbi:uncharacterized protein LOC114278708 [Camellia sinensis]|uniref:uncharacterized protein LOC114278708 n=1 Tax=Camellia sinensis TaxID=4442 RepID=UPI001035FC11|nr:uncharacterized protein LOC114278708 [Camellia sinensis]